MSTILCAFVALMNALRIRTQTFKKLLKYIFTNAKLKCALLFAFNLLVLTL